MKAGLSADVHDAFFTTIHIAQETDLVLRHISFTFHCLVHSCIRDKHITREPANCPERKGARVLLTTILADFPELLKLWVDGGFNGPEFAAWVQTQHPKLVMELVKRLAEVPGFHVLTKRWVVERTFG